jgi:hypothetical protein
MKRAKMLGVIEGESDRERNVQDKKIETPLDWAVTLGKEEADSCGRAARA